MLTKLAWSQGLDVTASVSINRASEEKSTQRTSSADVVVWLTPLRRGSFSLPAGGRSTYVLTQKDKRFSPHVLVVPTGSNVKFPNLDPFFHNVFSLFNGKRFDLGLYEPHTERTVLFDREGVSYIFCNIHPEMGAVIVTVNTSYYGISSKDGSVLIPNVPPGTYRLNVWAENVTAVSLSELTRVIEISPKNGRLGVLRLKAGPDSMKRHLNKFGEPYPPPMKESY